MAFEKRANGVSKSGANAIAPSLASEHMNLSGAGIAEQYQILLRVSCQTAKRAPWGGAGGASGVGSGQRQGAASPLSSEGKSPKCEHELRECELLRVLPVLSEPQATQGRAYFVKIL